MYSTLAPAILTTQFSNGQCVDVVFMNFSGALLFFYFYTEIEYLQELVSKLSFIIKVVNLFLINNVNFLHIYKVLMSAKRIIIKSV